MTANGNKKLSAYYLYGGVLIAGKLFFVRMAGMISEVVQLCCDLISIPSINPQSVKDFDMGIYGEERAAGVLAGWFTDRAVHAEVKVLSPGRANTIAHLKGDDSSRRYLLCGHLDTVGIDGMNDPFKPEIRDGKIFGRGACDDKGPLAAMCVAAAELSIAGKLPCDIVVLGSCGEEYDMRGAANYAAEYGKKLTGAILAEPTGFDVIYAHKGVVRLRVVVPGISAHSSMPELADNAIYTAAKAIAEIEKFAEIKRSQRSHPLLGTETVVPTIINGGSQINVIPDSCEIKIDWRTLPGRTVQDCVAELDIFLKNDVRDDIEVFPMESGAVAIESDKDSDMIRLLSEISKAMTGKGNKIVAGYATDGSALAGLGIPLAVFGPGSVAQAHKADEHIEIEQLEKAVDIFKEFLLKL